MSKAVARLSLGAKLRANWPLLLAIVAFGCGFVLLSGNAPVRVGDGSEYYAMYFAWRDGLRPFMTADAWQQYGLLVDSRTVASLVPVDALRATFPALMLGNTADFNHFWLYSLLAATVSLCSNILPVHFGPHASFLATHALLVTMVLTAAWRHFRLEGLIVATIILAASPIVWYFDKAHSELFTVCLVTAGVFLLQKRRLLPCAFLIAIASTQNISLGATAGVVLLADLVRRPERRAYVFVDVVLVCATVVALIMHPAYYFFRFGVLTPQLLTGGASIGANLATFYLWFVDPDLGLLPNWPLIALMAAIAIGLAVHRRRSPHRVPPASRGELPTSAFATFAAWYAVTNLFAQASTINLNSAATPGLARYALWYIPLFVPLLLSVVRALLSHPEAPEGKPRATRRIFTARHGCAVLIAIFGSAYATHFFDPRIPESGSSLGAYQPSWASHLVQRWIPFAYDPPPEVFRERYGNNFESPDLLEARAIIGPDCRKLLIQDRPKQLIFGGSECGLVPDKVRAVLDARDDARTGYRYVSLTASELAQMRIRLDDGTWYPVTTGSDGVAVLNQGWYPPETWGTWSSGAIALLSFPCSIEGASAPKTLTLGIRGFVGGTHPRVGSRYEVQGQELASVVYSTADEPERLVRLRLPEQRCGHGRLDVLIQIDAPASPSSLGMSVDGRNLGIGITRFRFD